jgi:hypothetical protein
MNPSALDFFASPAWVTDPVPHARLFADLRGDLPGLVRAVQGLVVHVFHGDLYGLRIPPERQAEVQIRPVAHKIARILELDPRPLSEARPPERRLVGNCRDFSVLLVAMLRARGVPARARCGFGTYFIPHHYEDHWVAEVWDAGEQRWRLVDAQMDPLQVERFRLDFDPLDVPRHRFISGGLGWQLCRSGQADPQAFGIADMAGLWFVRGDFVRDVAALNKIELLPWDGWGYIDPDGGDAGLSPADLAALDEMAALSALDVPDFAEVRRRYLAQPGWTVPPEIRSYSPAGVVQVALPAGD